MTQTVNKCTKRVFRDRYYSSMNYEEYYLLFGPPTPLVKPQDDPTQDIPELCLDSQYTADQHYFAYSFDGISPRYDSRQQQNCQIDGQSVGEKSDQVSKEFCNSTNQTQERNKEIDLQPENKQKFTRPRSKSDNTEYLIFTFLDKINKKGKKKIKLQ